MNLPVQPRTTAVLSALLTVAGLAALPSVAQADRIWRCGNEYTNNAREAEARGCRAVEGGNVTIVQGTRVAPAAQAQAPAAPAAPVRVASTGGPARGADGDAQRSRDAEARTILEGELRRAEARLAELQREYNNGEPERRGDERNYQRYLDRVAELKASVARAEADIQGIRRELSRLPAATQ